MCVACSILTPAERRERHGPASQEQRNAQIRALAAAKVPISKIADTYGLSRQRVDAIVRAEP